MTDVWAGFAESFVDMMTASVKGKVRVNLLHRQLRDHLAEPPAAVVDVGGGAGHQSLPLARLGYQVTIVDQSPAMLAKAGERLAGEPPEVRERVRLVESGAAEAPDALGGKEFAAVLCYGVIMYVEDAEPVVAALCRLAAPGGLVSIATLNAETLAVRPALEGRWADALAAFDEAGEASGALGVPTHAHTVDELAADLDRYGVRQEAWYGTLLFTDGWTGAEPTGELADILAVEWEASHRDPYRQLSRMFHLIGRKG
jgi:S-adenosylmethionine-dependent methyltransferase